MELSGWASRITKETTDQGRKFQTDEFRLSILLNKLEGERKKRRRIWIHITFFQCASITVYKLKSLKKKIPTGVSSICWILSGKIFSSLFNQWKENIKGWNHVWQLCLICVCSQFGEIMKEEERWRERWKRKSSNEIYFIFFYFSIFSFSFSFSVAVSFHSFNRLLRKVEYLFIPPDQWFFANFSPSHLNLIVLRVSHWLIMPDNTKLLSFSLASDRLHIHFVFF